MSGLEPPGRGGGGCTRGGRRVNGKGRGDKDKNEKLEGTSNRRWVGGERGGKILRSRTDLKRYNDINEWGI